MSICDWNPFNNWWSCWDLTLAMLRFRDDRRTLCLSALLFRNRSFFCFYNLRSRLNNTWCLCLLNFCSVLRRRLHSRFWSLLLPHDRWSVYWLALTNDLAIPTSSVRSCGRCCGCRGSPSHVLGHCSVLLPASATPFAVLHLSCSRFGSRCTCHQSWARSGIRNSCLRGSVVLLSWLVAGWGAFWSHYTALIGANINLLLISLLTEGLVYFNIFTHVCCLERRSRLKLSNWRS